MCGTVSCPAYAQSNSPSVEQNAKPTPDPERVVTPRASPWSFSGYGELILGTSYYHPDTRVNDSSYRDTRLDLARVAFFVGNQISERISFQSEIEFEHGGTGVTKEIEWDETGEYETEIEKGGEISLEQAYLEARLSDNFTARAGHLLVPVGMTTNYHLPTLFSSTKRPESESHLIPSVWHESGFELAFQWRSLSVRALAVTGLDSTGFSSDHWIAGGSQRQFETPSANEWATAASIDFSGLRGTSFGVSAYTSGTSANRPKRDMSTVDARVTIADAHVRFNQGPFKFRGLALMGQLSNADAVTKANATLTTELGAPRTPVASGAYALFAEAAVDVVALVHPGCSQRFDLFARYDAYDSMWHAPAKFDNPMMQRRVFTYGVNYFPHPRVVIKAEMLTRWTNQNNDWSRKQVEANGALGFVL